MNEDSKLSVLAFYLYNGLALVVLFSLLGYVLIGWAVALTLSTLGYELWAELAGIWWFATLVIMYVWHEVDVRGKRRAQRLKRGT